MIAKQVRLTLTVFFDNKIELNYYKMKTKYDEGAVILP